MGVPVSASKQAFYYSMLHHRRPQYKSVPPSKLKSWKPRM